MVDASECAKVLIKSTFSLKSGRFKDWRLANHVDKQTYQEAKDSVGVDGEIYGVPIGADWDEFRKNIQKASEDHKESLTEWETLNILWTGIDATTAHAYTACIDAAASNQVGIHLSVGRMTDTDITLRLKWTPMGGGHDTVALSWSGSLAHSPDLPKKITVGPGLSFVVKRPSQQSNLAVNIESQGAGDSVTLFPLPPVPPPLPTHFEKTTNENTQPLQNGSSATWVVPALQEGTYQVSVAQSARSQADGEWLRINYSISLDGTLISEPGAWFDINPPGASHTAVANKVVQLRGRASSITLTIAGVYDHANFQNGSAGAIVLDNTTKISLTKVG